MELPELRKMLDAAANAVAEPRQSGLEDVRRTARRRRVAYRALSVAAIVVVAVVASGVGVSLASRSRDARHVEVVTPPKTTAASTGPPTTTARQCSEADIEKPIGDMPAPRRVTKRFMLNGSFAWLDPTESPKPAITAESAWRTLTKYKFGGGRPELLLGSYSSLFPFTAGAPENLHVLAWVVYIHGSAIVPHGGPVADPQPGVTAHTDPPPPCLFGDSYFVMNAATGQELIEAAHS